MSLNPIVLNCHLEVHPLVLPLEGELIHLIPPLSLSLGVAQWWSIVLLRESDLIAPILVSGDGDRWLVRVIHYPEDHVSLKIAGGSMVLLQASYDGGEWYTFGPERCGYLASQEREG